MNQILYFSNSNENNKKNLKKFKIQLYISLTLGFIFIFYWIYFYKNTDKEKISESLLNNYNIERLYSNNSNYTVVELNSDDTFIIGIIEIPKIDIKYPILSNISDELLKVSACKFYGPSPNKVGNLCIAAHNYDDDRFFGNLHKLDVGDIINIYDSNNQMLSYVVYNKYEISKSDTSCTSQDTNNKKELTLITCNNINKNRLIIKATQK